MGEHMKKNLNFIFTDKMFEINNSQKNKNKNPWRNLRQKLPPAGTDEFLTEKPTEASNHFTSMIHNLWLV